MLNLYQRRCAAAYAAGDFEHIGSIDEARASGDTLFAFLMIELATSEGCDSAAEARRRLEMVIQNVADVITAIANEAIDNGAQLPTQAPVPKDCVMLHFRPQAWIQDYAVNVDSETPDRWPVSRVHFLECFPTSQDWHECDEDRDAMRLESAAPHWVRDWTGPYEIELLAPEDPWSSHLS